MWKEQQIEEYLKENLKPKRFAHSLSVRDTAVKLAETYGYDKEKAKIAGLVHDCAKNMSDEKLISIAKDNGCNIDEVYINNPQLLHGFVGAIVAREVMGIEDEEILNAVIYHTTGKKHMEPLEKIIYIADYIEPLRTYYGIDKLREITYKDLDRGMLEAFNSSIKFVVDRGQMLHLNTVEARNYLLCNNSR